MKYDVLRTLEGPDGVTLHLNRDTYAATPSVACMVEYQGQFTPYYHWVAEGTIGDVKPTPEAANWLNENLHNIINFFCVR